MEKIKAAIALTRWREWYGKVIFITLLGSFLVKSITLPTVSILLFANLLSGAFAFMVNDVEDAPDDALDAQKRKRNPISAGRISHNAAQALTFSFGYASLVLYILLGFWIFLFGAMGLIVGFLYSHRKVRLKSRPIIDLLSHGFFLGIAYFLTAIFLKIKAAPLYGVLWLGAPIFTMSLLGDINNEIRDYEVDRLAGLKNTASIINLKKFRNLVFYLSFLPLIVIFVYLVVHTPFVSKISISGAVSFVIIHYLWKWYGKRKSVCYYPYGQELLAFIGLVLLLNP